MIGLILGLACGVCELFLLVLLIRSIAAGNLRFWVLPAKMAVLALFFVPCGLLRPGELHIAGIAAAGSLVAGGVVIAVTDMLRRKKGADEVAK